MKKLEADVLIVGGGAAGLAAAITAAEQNATVLLFEKMSTTGGCSNMAAGPLGVESSYSKNSIIGLTKEDAVQKFMNYTHWRSDERLVRDYLYQSGDTIDWLAEMGVKFLGPMHYFPGSEETWHFIATKDGKMARRTGAIMVQCMTDRAVELGVEIFLEAPVQDLIQEDGRIVGLHAKNADGEIEARGGAVIISTGGFADNPDMIEKATGLKWGEEFYSLRIPGISGDGIQMSWSVGAKHSRMEMETAYFMPNTMCYETVETPFRQCDLLVNVHGERFYNEELMQNPIFTANNIKLQPKYQAWSIADDAQIERYIKNGPNFNMISTIGYDWSRYREELDEWIKNRPDCILKADSLEELCQKTGIKLEALKKTLETYNQYSTTGDELFHKDKKYIHAINGPQYYAMKFVPCAYGSLGGISIDYKTQVVDKNWNPIPGLYAAGTDANSLYDPDYVFTLPGNTLAFALNSGRIAGRNAISYIQENFA